VQGKERGEEKIEEAAGEGGRGILKGAQREGEKGAEETKT